MIKVFTKQQGNLITEIEFKGHALFADEGQDIVCASVTTAAIVTANAIERLFGQAAITSEATSGNIKLVIKKTDNIIEQLLQNLIDSLNELADQYPNNIKIL